MWLLSSSRRFCDDQGSAALRNRQGGDGAELVGAPNRGVLAIGTSE
jgi:hypothetical protein